MARGARAGARLDDLRVLEHGAEVGADLAAVDEGVHQEILGAGRDLDEAGEPLGGPGGPGGPGGWAPETSANITAPAAGLRLRAGARGGSRAPARLERAD